MGRKKSTPRRITGETSVASDSSEYLGTLGHVAANGLPTPLEDNAPNESERPNLTASAAGEPARNDVQASTPPPPPTKRVKFATDTLTTEFDPVTPPEIEFITESPLIPTPTETGKEDPGISEKHGVEEIDEETTPILRYNYHPYDHESEESNDASKLSLGKFILDSSVCLEATTPEGARESEEAPMLPFKIRTSQGAQELLQFLHHLSGKDQGTIEMKNVGLAVQLGMMSLMINQNPQARGNRYVVALSLSKNAFEICSPRVLPVKASKVSNAYQAALTLQRAFCELFPRYSIMFPLAKERNGQQAITAKQVYAWVDNLQIKAYLSKKHPPQNNGKMAKLEIPGLAPTLRPYQEAAVKWMLEREKESALQSSSRTGEEWELAWIVVDAENKHIFFLPDHTKHVPPHQFLFCPFTNWLACSMEEAKNMTFRTSVDPKKKKKTDQATVARGGIIADSMGLGKTVEVLACILANPDLCHKVAKGDVTSNVVSRASSESLSSQGSSTARVVASKQEQVGLSANEKSCPTSPSKTSSSPRNASRTSHRRLVTPEHRPATAAAARAPTRRKLLMSQEVETGRVSPSYSSQSSSDNEGAAIDNIPTNLEERWIESKHHELGSCVCGKSISMFPTPPEADSVVQCKGCREPMHWACAAFHSEREHLGLMNEGVIYRQRFSHTSFWCRLCPPTYCPCCVANGIAREPDSKIRSRATVIVTPKAILDQWGREISRHTHGTLKVSVYSGVRNLCCQQQGKGEYKSRLFVHPRFLADSDIVLMTYETLHQDLGHSDSNPYAGNGRASLRKRKRYRVVPSPLSSISWWRVCIDEAQRVETPTVGSAQMALKLDTHHRWCVSGTPIGRGKLDDLFGLLLFLRLTPPFNNMDWCRQCFSSFGNDIYTEKRLKALLANVFWRSTKSLESVASQVGVPPQVVKTKVLQFSSVEKHFYSTIWDETMQAAGDLSNNRMQSKRKRRRDKNLELLQRQIGKLRAACCHPQVGSSGMALGKKKSRSAGSRGGVKVLSMDQVLDRLIDDARNKCEEALRVSLFHTNPMATISRLKVEARRDHNVKAIKESDEFLYAHSCKLYQDAIELADENASPSLVTEEVVLSGSTGFRSSSNSVRGGSVLLGWQLQQPTDTSTPDKPWANFEYEGQGKKMRQIRVRSLADLPLDLALQSESWRIRSPRHCVVQVASAAAGGSFVDLLSIELPKPVTDGDSQEDWVTQVGPPIYRAKAWRIVVQTFYSAASGTETGSIDRPRNDYVGLEVEFYEPTIGFDSLQRLHTLHNAIISFRQLQTVQSGKQRSSLTPPLPLQLSDEDIATKVHAMELEYAKIETYSLEYAKNVRNGCARRLESLISARQKLELDLRRVTGVKDENAGFWDVAWWDEIVAAVVLEGTEDEKHSLCEKVHEAVDGCDTYEQNSEFYSGRKAKGFPDFHDVNGLAFAIRARFDNEFLSELRGGRYHECIMSVLALTPNPTNAEVLENQTCSICKADWGQTGPMCGHCKVGEKLKVLQVDSQKLARHVLEAILKWSKAGSSGVRNSSRIRKCLASANKFFEIIEVSRREALAASRLWKVHLELLNVLDELNSSKTPMRLVNDGEDLRDFTEEQKNALVVPVDVCVKYHEHEAKQATTLATLDQQKHTLTFLKNLIAEEGKSQSCMICLAPFTTDRAVLTCGHSFHLPCLEWFKKKQQNSSQIRCPSRCKTLTICSDVMIASSKRSDDGTKKKREVKGNFGTKVNALVGDLLEVSDIDEKSVVFSMQEDMLDIVEEALNTNGVKFVRASSLAKISESTKRFRSSDCYVLLLNVKNGAEGLNLIEARHVFMIEPLLNCGLDSQAIARVHRIGQTQQTYVHRYLVANTIEVKIDEYRQQHQQVQLEDALMSTRACVIQAGGIDGGFSSKDELMDMLRLPQNDEQIEACDVPLPPS